MIEEPISVAAREPRYLAGFTAIGIVVLAAIAYSIRISLDPAAGNHLLTTTFLVANVAGWLLGSTLRERKPASVVGLLLVLLADAIFPLNLFAPLILFVPGLRGNVPATVTAVVIVGIAYHLWNYRRRTTARFALAFYPYFFAFASGTAIVLLRFTAGLSMPAVAWLALLYAVAFNELSYRLRPEPALHFAIAGAAVLTGSAVVSAVASADRGPASLAALGAVSLVSIASAIRERSSDAIARAHGFAAWIAVTLTFTALLYFAHSPLWVYLVATGAWTVALALFSMLPAREWSEPFHESAWWTAVVLATALAAALWQVWMPFIIRTMGAKPPRQAAALALAEAGVALLAVSAWRRRYPPIASSLRGFVTNNVLLRVTSYAAPLMLIVALAGGWSLLSVGGLGAPQPAHVYALVAAGVLLLIAGPLLTRQYPAEALDFAGVLAMVFSAFNALASATLSASVFFAAAAIFLVRYLRGARTWSFAAFLALTAAGLSLQRIGTLPATIVFVAAAAVIAFATGRASGVMARIGYWSAHVAAFAFWLSLARQLGLGSAYDAVLIAAWAWFAFAVSRIARREPAPQTAWQVSIVLAAAALVVALFVPGVQPAGTRVVLVALLTVAALLLELRHLHYAGFALLGVAVVLAANRGDGRWLAGVLAVSALVLLWRSLSRGSSFGHLLFVGAAVAAAVLTMPDRGTLQVLPIAILVAGLLVVELLVLKLQAANSFHADLTAVMSLLLAVTIIIAEVASARFSVHVLAVLLLSVIVIRPWIAASRSHRVQPGAHAAFGVIGPVAGAALVVAAARLAGLTAGQQVFALACTGWIVLAWLLRLQRGTTASGAIAVALHLIGAGVYVAAFIVRGPDPFLVLACLATAGIYVAWLAARRATLLEHLAAVGVVEAVALWGLAHRMAWPEFYLLPAAAYLCLVLLRRTAPRIENLLAAIAIATAVGYPYFALLRTAQGVHLAFLGIASIVVIHVLLATRRHTLMVFAVCAMLGIGMLFGAVVVRGDVRLNLLMALVGFLVIADLGVIGSRTDRRPLAGEIEL